MIASNALVPSRPCAATHLAEARRCAPCARLTAGAERPAIATPPEAIGTPAGSVALSTSLTLKRYLCRHSGCGHSNDLKRQNCSHSEVHISACRSEERRVGKECKSRRSPGQ